MKLLVFWFAYNQQNLTKCNAVKTSCVYYIYNSICSVIIQMFLCGMFYAVVFVLVLSNAVKIIHMISNIQCKYNRKYI